MKITTFRKLELMIKKYGSHLTFNKDVELNMTELPDGIQSITVNDGSLYGDQLTKLPDDITIKADGHIWLDNLTTMGNDVAIEADKSICLRKLTTIGNNVVIGAGSVVTKDIPDWVVAVGNPCKVQKRITEEDRQKLYKDEDIDAEAWEDIVNRGFV